MGQVSEIVLLMRDITRRKEAEFKLLQADRMAAIGLLAAGIAHEINNPMTSIAGFSEGLLKRLKHLSESGKDKGLESFREYLEIIFNEAYRCKDIIQNLLEYSRQPTEGTETLEMDQIIKDSVSLVRQHAKDSRIKIIVKNGLTKGFNRILGNESQLKHLFLNVFNNAFRSMDDGGQLTIVSKTSGNLIEIPHIPQRIQFRCSLTAKNYRYTVFRCAIRARLAHGLIGLLQHYETSSRRDAL